MTKSKLSTEDKLRLAKKYLIDKYDIDIELYLGLKIPYSNEYGYALSVFTCEFDGVFAYLIFGDLSTVEIVCRLYGDGRVIIEDGLEPPSYDRWFEEDQDESNT